MATKVKEVVMYEAVNGALYKTKEEAEAVSLEIEKTEIAMIELDRLMDCNTTKFFDSNEKYEISVFIIENRKNLIKFLNF